MRTIKAPQKYESRGNGEHTIFLAGGISNCPDWQKELESHLYFAFGIHNFVVFNPRRDKFDFANERESVKQIEWEHSMLEQCDTLLFWFPKETLCPITLYELGAYTGKKKNLVIGIDPHYKRKLDVITQTRLKIAGDCTLYVGWEIFLSGVAKHLHGVSQTLPPLKPFDPSDF